MSVRVHWSLLVILTLLFQSLHSQQTLSAAAEKIREQVGKIGVMGPVTVNTRDGSQYCGHVQRIDGTTFSVDEVDLKHSLALSYEDIQKVREGYGRKGFGGRRVHPRTNLIAGICIVSGLLAVVLIAVAQKD